ncbi:MAG: aromatic amino acid ammonia-lyase [Verrucomicrobiales bacterium]|nr:aromatic amino acid ammonia-lyase [Verrucomicrobiales bacterium]
MVTPLRKEESALRLSGQTLSVSEVYSVAAGGRRVTLTADPDTLARLQDAQNLVDEAVENQWKVYGLTTGFGSLANQEVPSDLANASQENLLSFLSCGAGTPINGIHVRAAMLLRANMLLHGASGVRIELIERYLYFLNHGVTPIVKELGSIGASGDLVPLATIARAITGQAASCQVEADGRHLDRDDALVEMGLPPLELRPKEALAMINGTTFSSAIAANCVSASRTYLGLSLAAHAMMIRSLLGHQDPFDPFVHECKPHPGQIWTAKTMRSLLGIDEAQNEKADVDDRNHLQDRYSLRCLPQYFGPLVEGILRVQRTIETEMNSVTDNPLIDVRAGRFLQSGNFLGQYVGMAMDDLRRCLGLLAKHLDVQIAHLVSPEFNHGLPASLVGNQESPINMGLKGLQITGNSIMPMLTYLGNPHVEHFPTHAEQYNQNINGLSWGAANLASQSVDLYANYLPIALIFGVQGADLRSFATDRHYDGRALLSPLISRVYEVVYEAAGREPGKDRPLLFNDQDFPLENLVETLKRDLTEGGSLPFTVAPLLETLDEIEFAL